MEEGEERRGGERDPVLGVETFTLQMVKLEFDDRRP